MSHLGRPKDSTEERFSLKNILYKVSEELGQEVLWGGDCIGVVRHLN